MSLVSNAAVNDFSGEKRLRQNYFWCTFQQFLLQQDECWLVNINFSSNTGNI